MVSVVEEIYCSPYTTELVVKRRRISLSKDIFEVFNLSGDLFLTVNGLWNLRRERILRDSNGLPLLSMRTKGIISVGCEWEAYKRDSNEPEDVIFSVIETNIFSFKMSLDIFLRRQQSSTDNHITDQLADFRVSSSYMSSSFKLYELSDNTLLAEVVQNSSWGGLMVGNYSFKVKINPNVDVAFVIAMIIITDDTSNFRSVLKLA